MIQAVIFDLDGTLVDSNEAHVSAWQRAFRKFGKNFSKEQLSQHIGKGADQYLPAFLDDEELRSFGDALDKFRSGLYKKEYLPEVRPFPKVHDLLARIKQDGKKIALASSGKGEEVKHYAKIAGIEDLIDGQTTADDAEHSKPAPDIFAASLQKLGDPAPPAVMAVGDTPYDAKAAAKVSIRTIGLLCGGFPEAELRDAGAIAIYADPADLLGNYDSSPLTSSIRQPSA